MSSNINPPTTINLVPINGDQTEFEFTPIDSNAPKVDYKVYYLVKVGNSLRPVLVNMDEPTEREYTQRCQAFDTAFRAALPGASSPDIAFAAGCIVYKRNGLPKPVSITFADAAKLSPKLGAEIQKIKKLMEEKIWKHEITVSSYRAGAMGPVGTAFPVLHGPNADKALKHAFPLEADVIAFLLEKNLMPPQGVDFDKYCKDLAYSKVMKHAFGGRVDDSIRNIQQLLQNPATSPKDKEKCKKELRELQKLRKLEMDENWDKYVLPIVLAYNYKYPTTPPNEVATRIITELGDFIKSKDPGPGISEKIQNGVIRLFNGTPDAPPESQFPFQVARQYLASRAGVEEGREDYLNFCRIYGDRAHDEIFADAFARYLMAPGDKNADTFNQFVSQRYQGVLSNTPILGIGHLDPSAYGEIHIANNDFQHHIRTVNDTVTQRQAQAQRIAVPRGVPAEAAAEALDGSLS